MNIYLNTETDFIHNGLGFLTDILNVNVEDNLNGNYSLYFEYKLNGQLSEFIQNENIVKCKVSDGTNQLFIIKDINKTFNSIKVNCIHIFYLLLDNFLEDVAPTNLSGQSFFKWILDRTNYSHNFKAHSDISTIKSARYVRRNPVDVLLGDADNSMVNIFGGELKRDNFDIYFNKKVGNDNGVKLMVGKNITGINITVDTNSVCTRIMPQGFNGLLLPEKYVDSPLINTYPNPKIKKIEFNDINYDPEDEEAYHVLEDAYEALRVASNELFRSGIDKPIINVKVDWIELSKTNEYKNYSNLEKVLLGDTVKIDLLGISYKTRVIKTVYNPLIDRIESFELGAPKANIGTSTNQVLKQVEKVNPNSILESARNSATQMLIKAMGGYIYKTQNELFIMDTDDTMTATKVWRWNLNGLGYSSNGIDGPYETAITQDGQIVADFITVGKIKTERIEGFEELVTDVKSLETLENNNYQELITKFDGYTPSSKTVEIEKSVTRLQTDTYTKTEVNTKLTDGSVTKVVTETGTFSNDGLTIEKTGAKSKGQFNESGLSVIDTTGSANERLLFAGYDEDLGESIVIAKNVNVEKYLTIGKNSRIEDYEDGTGIFYIG